MDAPATQQLDPAPAPSQEPAPPSPQAVPGPWFQYRVPHGFEWNRYTLPIAALPPALEGLRIVHLTDLHLKGFWSEAYDQLIQRIAHESPDLILVTGDFVDSKYRPQPAIPTVRRLIGALKAPLGCFGILGNHDRDHLAPYFDGLNLILLDRTCHRLKVNDAALELLALPGVHRRRLTPPLLDAYPSKSFGVPRLILAHFPDHLRKAVVLQPDVYFAGHTHGGQICLPNGFAFLRHDSLPRRLCKGVNRAGNTWLVVSRGLGFTRLPVRLFCPAEVIEITLTRG